MNRALTKGLLIGLGLGLIMAAAVTMVYIPDKSLSAPEAQDIELMARGLGMVYPDEVSTPTAGQDGTAGANNGNPVEEDAGGAGTSEDEDSQPQLVLVVIPEDFTATGIARVLEFGGVIEEAEALIALAVEQGLETRLKAGAYIMEGDMNFQEVLATLSDPPAKGWLRLPGDQAEPSTGTDADTDPTGGD